MLSQFLRFLQSMSDGPDRFFTTNKCFDKKSHAVFNERGIRYQFIDMKEKGMNKGEYVGVKQAVGGIENLLDKNSRDKDTLALIEYISDENKDEKLLENQKVIKTPVVRNGKQATVGYQPETWKRWL